MMGTLYEALREAKVPDDKARAAAEEVAAYDSRVNDMDRKIDRLDAKLGTVDARLGSKVDAVESRLDAKLDALTRMLFWMFGILGALNLLTLSLLLRGVLS